MAERRKSEVISSSSICVEESKAQMQSLFRELANDCSKLYSFAVDNQKLAFEAGRRYSLEKAYEWLMLNQLEGKFLTSTDFMTYLQNEMNCAQGAQLQEILASESNQSVASASMHMQQVPSHCIPPLESQELDRNALDSQDLEMDDGSSDAPECGSSGSTVLL